ncbi:hypothetical protein PM082_010045 [Marasmius tenuissimus]|nr:hypothetical protein PM082_010045 [Marasmius tenuissimus]
MEMTRTREHWKTKSILRLATMTMVSPEVHKDQQAFVDALCDDLTARYVRDPKPNKGPFPPQLTLLFLPSSSEPPTTPTYPSMSPRLSRPIPQIPLVD